MVKNEGNKGITLIALIVTIVVLLILAGVTINAITGSESAMEKATEAREKDKQGTELETIKLAVVNSVASDLTGLVNADNLKEGLNGLVEDEGRLRINKDNSPWIVTGKTGMKYKINQNGEVTSAEPVASVEFVKTEDTIAVGKSKKLEIIAKGASGNVTEANEVIFSSSDEDIATVEEDGSIKIVNDESKIGETVTISVVADGVNGSNECVITIIEVPKPQIDENIILGNAIVGVGPAKQDGTPNDSNQDDWKILCYDEEKRKVYVILDSYLPITALPEGVDVDTDLSNPYSIYKTRKSVNNSDTETRDAFISELTTKTKWRSLVSNPNPNIEVYGALPGDSSRTQAGTEKTMDYIYIKRGNKYFSPSNTNDLPYGGYWFALAPTNATDRLYKFGFYAGNNNTVGQENYYDTSVGVCPVVILPEDIVEKNENGIWEIK